MRVSSHKLFEASFHDVERQCTSCETLCRDSGRRSALLADRGDVNGAAYNGRIYLTGGEYETTKIKESFWAFESYAPATDTWETLPHIGITRHGFAAGFIGNTLHVVGGSFQSDGMPGVFSPTATPAPHPRARSSEVTST